MTDDMLVRWWHLVSDFHWDPVLLRLVREQDRELRVYPAWLATGMAKHEGQSLCGRPWVLNHCDHCGVELIDYAVAEEVLDRLNGNYWRTGIMLLDYGPSYALSPCFCSPKCQSAGQTRGSVDAA